MSIIGTGLNAVETAVDPITVLGHLASGAAGSIADAGLDAVSGWVLAGTAAALHEVIHEIGVVTTPALGSTWFSASYWRVAGLAAMLTIPFLFAAAIQAVIRSDLPTLLRAAFVDLPIAFLGVAIAAPLVTLLLAATDQMSSLVSTVGASGSARFLDKAAEVATNASAIDGSAFFAVVVGLFLLAAAIAVTLELLIREAAVYVVVLMLPLAFAALVWPARRIWATRLVELLMALILSKFVIVAVLSLAGAALGHSSDGPGILLPAMALVFIAAFSPWAVLRILPFAELAAGAAGAMKSGLPSAGPIAQHLLNSASGGSLSDAMHFSAGPETDPVTDRAGPDLEGLRASGAANASSRNGRSRGTPPDGHAGAVETAAVPAHRDTSDAASTSNYQAKPIDQSDPGAFTTDDTALRTPYPVGSTQQAGNLRGPDDHQVAEPDSSADSRTGTRRWAPNPLLDAPDGSLPEIYLGGPHGWSGPWPDGRPLPHEATNDDAAVPPPDLP
jgi:hypothetical protein